MQKLQEVFNKLKEQGNTLKKNQGREFTASYLLTKLRELHNLKSEFSIIFNGLKLDDQKLYDQLRAEFSTKYRELEALILGKTQSIKEILDSSLLENTTEEEIANTTLVNNLATSSKKGTSQETNKMALNIAEVTKLIPTFDGSPQHLSNFVNLAEYLYDDLNTQEDKAKLIKFLLRTKLDDKVRNRITSEVQPTDFKSFKDTLYKLFKPHKNALKIQNELSKIRQGDKDLQDYIAEIDKLIADLNNVQITDMGEENREIITKMNEKIALNSFKSGLRNTIKYTIFASRPKTYTDAIDLAQEIEAEQTKTEENRIHRIQTNPRRPIPSHRSNFNRNYEHNYHQGRRYNTHTQWNKGQNSRFNQRTTDNYARNNFQQNGNSFTQQRRNSNQRPTTQHNARYQNRQTRRINFLETENQHAVPTDHQVRDEGYQEHMLN